MSRISYSGNSNDHIVVRYIQNFPHLFRIEPSEPAESESLLNCLQRHIGHTNRTIDRSRALAAYHGAVSLRAGYQYDRCSSDPSDILAGRNHLFDELRVRHCDMLPFLLIAGGRGQAAGFHDLGQLFRFHRSVGI